MRADSLHLDVPLGRTTLVVLCTCIFSCASVIGLDDLHRGLAADAGAGAGADAAGPVTPVTAGGTSTGPPGPGPAGPAGPPGSACAGKAGPAAVRLSAASGSFCIDVSEVTNDDYAAFLATNPQPPGGGGGGGGGGGFGGRSSDPCHDHGSYQPSQGWPYAASDGRLPVTWVDWCDAQAYCAWAGKTLCAADDGSPLGPSTDPANGQWYSACTGPSGNAYPYGGAYVSGTCNDGSANGGPVSVASRASCVGGVAGLFDMSGNVAEWENACSGDRSDDTCSQRGGAFDSSASSGGLACAGRNLAPRGNGAADVGIRCCAP